MMASLLPTLLLLVCLPLVVIFCIIILIWILQLIQIGVKGNDEDEDKPEEIKNL